MGETPVSSYIFQGLCKNHFLPGRQSLSHPVCRKFEAGLLSLSVEIHSPFVEIHFGIDCSAWFLLLPIDIAICRFQPSI